MGPPRLTLISVAKPWIVESPAFRVLTSHWLWGFPSFEFSQTMSFAIAGLQPKVCAFATPGEKLQSNKPKAINNPLEEFLLSDLGRRGRRAELALAACLRLVLLRSACTKLID